MFADSATNNSLWGTIVEGPANHAQLSVANNRNDPVAVVQWDRSSSNLQAALSGVNAPTTKYTYQVFDELYSVLDPDQELTTMDYDGIGRKTSISNPSTGTKSFAYNSFDEAVRETDAVNTRCYSYDVLGRPTQLDRGVSGSCATTSETIASWQYDAGFNAGGKLTSTFRQDKQGSPNGTTMAYSYEAVGRIKSITQTVHGSEPLTTSFDYYGPWLNIVHYPGPAGSAPSIMYNYDQIGVPTQVFDPWGGNTTNANGDYWKITAFDNGQRIASEQFGNNIVSSYTYFVPGSTATECNSDSNNPYSCMPGTLKSETTSATNQQVLRAHDYNYDRNGNLWMQHNTGGDGAYRYYIYDAFGRLTQQINQDSTRAILSSTSWNYSAGGDIQSKIENVTGTAGKEHDYLYDIAAGYIHHLMTVDNQQYGYDENGSQISRGDPIIKNGPQSIEYNDFNMPSEVSGNTTDGRVTSLEYDASHQRVAKRGPERTTIYVGDLYECEGANPPATGGALNCDTHRYKIYGGGKLVAVVTDKDFTPRSTRFVHGDRLGSSSLVTDEQGHQVGELREFEAFGDSTTDFSVTGINSGFTGQDHDAELGLINMGGRLYDPKVGRFITADPFVPNPLDPQGLNRYSYVQNNPLNATDPSGFEPFYDPGVPPNMTPAVPATPSSPSGPPGLDVPSNSNGNQSAANGSGVPDNRTTIPIMPDGPGHSPHVDSSSSNPGGSRAPNPPSPPSPAAPSPPPVVASSGPPATPPSPEGGPSTQGIAGPGNVSLGALSNPGGGPQSPNNPGTSWSPGNTGAPSSGGPNAVGYRGSNAGGGPSIARLPLDNGSQGFNSAGQPLPDVYHPSPLVQIVYSAPLVVLTPAAMAELFGGSAWVYRGATGFASGYLGGLSTGQSPGAALGQGVVGLGIGAWSPFGPTLAGKALNSMGANAIVQVTAAGGDLSQVNWAVVIITGAMRFEFGVLTGGFSPGSLGSAWATGAANSFFGGSMRATGGW